MCRSSGQDLRGRQNTWSLSKWGNGRILSQPPSVDRDALAEVLQGTFPDLSTAPILAELKWQGGIALGGTCSSRERSRQTSFFFWAEGFWSYITSRSVDKFHPFLSPFSGKNGSTMCSTFSGVVISYANLPSQRKPSLWSPIGKARRWSCHSSPSTSLFLCALPEKDARSCELRKRKCSNGSFLFSAAVLYKFVFMLLEELENEPHKTSQNTAEKTSTRAWLLRSLESWDIAKKGPLKSGSPHFLRPLFCPRSTNALHPRWAIGLLRW